MAPSDLILHLGYPKAASTFLQERVFKQLRSVAVAVRPRCDGLLESPDPHARALNCAFARSPTLWDQLGPNLLRTLVEQATPTADPSRPILISDEGACRWAEPSRLGAHLQGAARAAAALGIPRLRAFVVVRRQDQWMGSYYAQVSDRRVGAGQAHFERFASNWVEPRTNYYRDGVILDYHGVYAAAAAALGADNILVVAQEDLRSNRSETLSRILGFVGADPQEQSSLLTRLDAGATASSSNERSVEDDVWAVRHPRATWSFTLPAAARLRSLGLPSSVSRYPRDPGRGDKVTMTDSLRALILDRYAEGNRALSEAAGLDLGRFGYFADAR